MSEDKLDCKVCEKREECLIKYLHKISQLQRFLETKHDKTLFVKYNDTLKSFGLDLLKIMEEKIEKGDFEK